MEVYQGFAIGLITGVVSLSTAVFLDSRKDEPISITSRHLDSGNYLISKSERGKEKYFKESLKGEYFAIRNLPTERGLATDVLDSNQSLNDILSPELEKEELNYLKIREEDRKDLNDFVDSSEDGWEEWKRGKK